MIWRQRASRAVILLILTPALFLNCNMWTTALTPTPSVSGLQQINTPPPASAALTPTDLPATAAAPTTTAAPAVALIETSAPTQVSFEPAGCLSAADQAALKGEPEMLAYADRLLKLPHPLARRALPASINQLDGSKARQGSVISLSVADVQNAYLIQRMMNALQVAGFVTWLRGSSPQGLHILALSLRDPELAKSSWAPYIQTYWQNRDAHPAGDETILPALKLLPCGWMVAHGLAPHVDSSWWSPLTTDWPDYARVAEAYLASTNDAAIQVARKINWLGDEGREGPNTMCGPLAWSILRDAGALPLDWGGWSDGPRSFWLGKPRENGRPWSLFPPDSYKLYEIRQPLGTYDFNKSPLYPGDFIYTYSEGDGFDHMLLVTEVDDAGNVYTVTNLIQMSPTKQTTIERVLLLNLKDKTTGIARNQWANDRVNGRTGHHSFDVFRWAWMEKDIQGVYAKYTVQAGDTLDLVALRWKTPQEAIARYNGINPVDSLSVGQMLKIPPVEGKGKNTH